MVLAEDPLTPGAPSPGSLRPGRGADPRLATLSRAPLRGWERVLLLLHDHRRLERHGRLAFAVLPDAAGVLLPQGRGEVVWPEVVAAQVHLARRAPPQEVAHTQAALHADALGAIGFAGAGRVLLPQQQGAEVRGVVSGHVPLEDLHPLLVELLPPGEVAFQARC